MTNGKFDSTDRWLFAGSAVCLGLMLVLAFYVGESIRSEHHHSSQSEASTAP